MATLIQPVKLWVALVNALRRRLRAPDDPHAGHPWPDCGGEGACGDEVKPSGT